MADARRGTGRLHVWALLALLLALLRAPCSVTAGDDLVVEDHVILKSGKILSGRVVGSEKIRGASLLRVETDFGQILVPRSEIKERAVAGKPAEGQAFRIHRIRVVQWHGHVQRRRTEGAPWFTLGGELRYADADGRSEGALLAPGDTIRTGADGTIDLMPHKDVWIRIAPNSEVEIVTGEVDATLVLHVGETIQKIRGNPRGAIYRVRTPSSVVDHVFIQGGKDSYFALRTGRPDQLVVKAGAARLNGKLVVRAGQRAGGAGAAEPADRAQLVALPPHTPRFPVDDLAYVPPGTYVVGGDPHVYDEKGTRTTQADYGCESFKVTLEGYLIDRREVTADEFHDFVAAQHGGLARDLDYPKPPEGKERWPVRGQSWDSAMQFARWCGKTLPTEAQWEVAAHAGKALQQPWGGAFTKKHRKLLRGAWTAERGWLPAEELQSVDLPTLDVSPFGVKGLVTNATEWCRDDWATSPFQEHMVRRLPGEGKAVRGWWAHMRLRWQARASSEGKVVPGFRCVVEFPSR